MSLTVSGPLALLSGCSPFAMNLLGVSPSPRVQPPLRPGAAFNPFFPGLLLVAYAEGDALSSQLDGSPKMAAGDLALFDCSLCVPVTHWASAGKAGLWLSSLRKARPRDSPRLRMRSTSDSLRRFHINLHCTIRRAGFQVSRAEFRTTKPQAAERSRSERFEGPRPQLSGLVHTEARAGDRWLSPSRKGLVVRCE